MISFFKLTAYLHKHQLLYLLKNKNKVQHKKSLFSFFYTLSEVTHLVCIWTRRILKISLRHFVFHMLDQLPFCILPNSALQPWCISSSCKTCRTFYYFTYCRILLNRKDTLLFSFYRNTYSSATKGRMYKTPFLYSHFWTG